MTDSSLPRARRVALRASMALLVFAAACADDTPTPTATPAPAPEGLLGVLRCEVGVASGDMTCVDASGEGGALTSRAAAGGPSLEQRTFGGQGTYVRLANSGNSLAGGIYSIDVTVQNLANLAMGTADGAARHADGVQVFFSGAPVATAGSGNVSVANPTGTAIFTAADQPYFQYGGSIGGTDQGELGADGMLASAETSSRQAVAVRHGCQRHPLRLRGDDPHADAGGHAGDRGAPGDERLGGHAGAGAVGDAHRHELQRHGGQQHGAPSAAGRPRSRAAAPPRSPWWCPA